MHATPATARNAPIHAPGAGRSPVKARKHRQDEDRGGGRRVETRPAEPCARAASRKVMPSAMPIRPLRKTRPSSLAVNGLADATRRGSKEQNDVENHGSRADAQGRGGDGVNPRRPGRAEQ